MVSETHKSKDFVEYLQKLDAAYPETAVIRLVLDNSSAHISKETRRYLATRPQRFVFVFTPTHGSWLNLIEVLFSKLTRSLLRGIRVASKAELIERLHQYFRELNAELRPHQVRYYVEKRDPDFEAKMADVRTSIKKWRSSMTA